MIWPNAHEITNGHTPAKCRGLGPEDRELLAGHIAQDDLPPGRLWVDCHVGPIPDFPPDAPDSLKRTLPNYQRRIDLIIDDGTYAHICELKPAASFVAFGQTLYYTSLITRHLTTHCWLYPTIITDAADPDIIPLCKSHSIYLYQLTGADYVPRGRPT